MAERKKTAIVNLRVRTKEPLRAQIEKAARKRGVSMNAETVARLEASFRDDDIESALAPVLASLARIEAMR